MKTDLKLVFIDIDGVLNNMKDRTSYLTYDPASYGLSESNVNALKLILKETGAKLVLITSWRNYEEDHSYRWRDLHFKSPLKSFITKLGIESFFGMMSAPHLDHMKKAYDVLGFFYLLKDKFGINKKDTRFAILDDQTDQDLSLFQLDFFCIKGDVGLTTEDARKIIHHLND